MARKGEAPRDMRSQSERVRPRTHGVPFGQDSPGERNAQEEALQQRVMVTLEGEPEWANVSVEVDVRGDTVWLRGSVDTINTKYRLEEIVKRVRGVEVVANDLRIRIGEALEEFTRNADAARLREDLYRASRHSGK
jgi:osmotically-inducible protein OsmY